MMLATPLGSGVQPAGLATQFQDKKSSMRFTGDFRRRVQLAPERSESCLQPALEVVE